MTTLALVLRLVSAAGWALLVLGGLVFDGFELGLLPMIALIALALVPHTLLLRSQVLFTAALGISFLPIVRLTYVLLTITSVGAESVPYRMWLGAGLVVLILFLVLLPVSLLLSFFSARVVRKV